MKKLTGMNTESVFVLTWFNVFNDCGRYYDKTRRRGMHSIDYEYTERHGETWWICKQRESGLSIEFSVIT